MASKTVVKTTLRGMITIPLSIRKKFHIKAGTPIVILEDEGKLQLIPLRDLEEIRHLLPSPEELKEEFEEDHRKELELEK
jgi:AbrB family looped-hinge helix DNA binding protein